MELGADSEVEVGILGDFEETIVDISWLGHSYSNMMECGMDEDRLWLFIQTLMEQAAIEYHDFAMKHGEIETAQMLESIGRFGIRTAIEELRVELNNTPEKADNPQIWDAFTSAVFWHGENAKKTVRYS